MATQGPQAEERLGPRRINPAKRGLTSQRLLAAALVFILASMGALLWNMPLP